MICRKCNNCGTEIVDNGKSTINSKLDSKTIYVGEYDLCEHCDAEFAQIIEKFLKVGAFKHD